MQKSLKSSSKNQKSQNQLNNIKSPHKNSLSKPLSQSNSTPSFSNQQNSISPSSISSTTTSQLLHQNNNISENLNDDDNNNISLEDKLQLLETELASKREV